LLAVWMYIVTMNKAMCRIVTRDGQPLFVQDNFQLNYEPYDPPAILLEANSNDYTRQIYADKEFALVHRGKMLSQLGQTFKQGKVMITHKFRRQLDCWRARNAIAREL